MRAIGFGLCATFFSLGLSCNAFIAHPLPTSPAKTQQGRKHASPTSMQTHELDGTTIRGPLQPVENFILVKVGDVMTSTTGGIVLPDQSQERPTEGQVIGAGPGRIHPHTGQLIPMCVSEGDKVMYGKWSGRKAMYDGAEHSIIMDDDLLLVYTGETITQSNLKMIRDQVLVKLEQAEVQSDGGIAISKQVTKDDAGSQGQVIAIGEGRTGSEGKLTPMPVAVGQYVKFREYAGTEIKIGADKFAVVRMVDCLCKWDP
ncbi:unnamed protein product [Chrysoparadoxa australica]